MSDILGSDVSLESTCNDLTHLVAWQAGEYSNSIQIMRSVMSRSFRLFVVRMIPYCFLGISRISNESYIQLTIRIVVVENILAVD